MKQLLIGTNINVNDDYTKNLTGLSEGNILVYDPSTNQVIGTDDKVSVNFAIALGRGTGKPAFVIPEVNAKNFQVTKTTKTDDVLNESYITVGSGIEKNTEYGINIVKTGVGFNERNKWHVSVISTSTSAQDITNALVKQLKELESSLNLEISTTANTIIKVKSLVAGDNYIIKPENSKLTMGTVVQGTKGVLTPEYLKDLASRCAAGKGFNLLAEGGKELYPGYPENTSIFKDAAYMYTLRFATKRASAHQVDEPVYQTVHLVIGSDDSSVNYLDTIFGLTVSSASE